MDRYLWAEPPAPKKVEEVGLEEGAICNRDGCEGTLELDPHHCHCALGGAPCSGCMYGLHCTECGVYTGPDGDVYSFD